MSSRNQCCWPLLHTVRAVLHTGCHLCWSWVSTSPAPFLHSANAGHLINAPGLLPGEQGSAGPGVGLAAALPSQVSRCSLAAACCPHWVHILDHHRMCSSPKHICFREAADTVLKVHQNSWPHATGDQARPQVAGCNNPTFYIASMSASQQLGQGQSDKLRLKLQRSQVSKWCCASRGLYSPEY